MLKLDIIIDKFGEKMQETEKNKKVKILFLCTGNSCRSQMAEGWTKALLSDIVEAYSAGIETHGLNPNAVKVMAEAGVDISGHRSKLLDEVKDIDFDYVITVCGHANENCPFFPGKTRVIHAGFDDPPRLAKFAKTEQEALDCYRRVRDEIKNFVLKIPEILISEKSNLEMPSLKELQKRLFDIAAKSWDEKPDRIELARAIYDGISSQVELSHRIKVLEYGCGTAILGFMLAQTCGKVVAADNSEGMLEQVRKKVSDNNINNIETKLLDLEKDEILDEKFDMIVSSMALHHIEKVELVLRKLAEMLNQNGIIAIADIVEEDGSFHTTIKVPHNGFSVKKLLEAFKNLGFQNCNERIVHHISRNNREYPIFLITAVK